MVCKQTRKKQESEFQVDVFHVANNGALGGRFTHFNKIIYNRLIGYTYWQSHFSFVRVKYYFQKLYYINLKLYIILKLSIIVLTITLGVSSVQLSYENLCIKYYIEISISQNPLLIECQNFQYTKIRIPKN